MLHTQELFPNKLTQKFLMIWLLRTLVITVIEMQLALIRYFSLKEKVSAFWNKGIAIFLIHILCMKIFLSETF